MPHYPKVAYNEYDEDVYRKACSLPVNDVTASVLANRATKYKVDPVAVFQASLKDLDNPASLPDIDKACEKIASVIRNGGIIALETDHDVDGVTSHAVLKTALVNFFYYPSEKIQSFIGHRMKEGYGLSAPLANRILEQDNPPNLIITADNGSSDGERISFLLEHGIETIVTDHHGMPEDGVPKDAVACVSPAREDSEFPDPLIAGVMVSFLLMCQLRLKLIDESLISPFTPKLTELLDFVALGTVADCVSLSRSLNNRALIKAGLNRINNLNRDCWRAIKLHLGDESKEIGAKDLGFAIGPRINAAGRLDDAMVGVRYLLSDSLSKSSGALLVLDKENNKRKDIENELKEEALMVGEIQADLGKKAIQVNLTNGHAGVHGIVASRLVERFGRPSVCFSEKLGEPDLLSASARGIEGVHIRNAMQYVATKNPAILQKFGGHEGAGGLTINKSDLLAFNDLFEEAIALQVGDRQLEPVIYSDGMLNTDLISVEMIRDLEKLEPFGREFESPIFTSKFRVIDGSPLGKATPTKHWSIKLIGSEGGIFKGVWFNSGSECPIPDAKAGNNYLITYSPEINVWRGNESIQIMIKTIEKC